MLIRINIVNESDKSNNKIVEAISIVVKNQNWAKFKILIKFIEPIFKWEFITSEARLIFAKLKQVFIKALIFHYLISRYYI